MADVKLLKYDGTEQQYKGVERVQLAKVDGGTVIFSEGEAVEGIEISPDFSSGDMPVTAPAGTLVKSAYITKPDALKPENVRKGINVAGIIGDFIGDTEELITNLAFSSAGGVEETELFPEQAVSGFVYNSSYGCFVTRIMQIPFIPVVGETYCVEWDGEQYERKAFSFTALDGASCVGVGNTIMTGNNSGEPFLICYDITNHMFYFFSTQDSEVHTISVSQSITTSYGNMIVCPTEEGKVISKVTILKPESLIPENVRAGVSIGGIEGSFDSPDPVETEVELNFSNGPMEVVPETGKVFDKVKIPLPETLAPENIRKGVSIAGIEGAFSAGYSGDIKIATAFFTPSSSTNCVVPHSLGTIPDVLIVASQKSTSSHITFASGTSRALANLMNTGDDPYLNRLDFLTASNTNFGIGSDIAIDEKQGEDAIAGFIEEATPFNFKIGNSTTPMSTSTDYRWYAIGGLAEHSEFIYLTLSLDGNGNLIMTGGVEDIKQLEIYANQVLVGTVDYVHGDIFTVDISGFVGIGKKYTISVAPKGDNLSEKYKNIWVSDVTGWVYAAPFISIDIANNSVANIGTGGSGYNATLVNNGYFSGGKFVVSSKGGLSIPTSFMNGNPTKWTIAWAVDSYTPSTYNYSRFARGNKDVPSLFYALNKSNMFKLASSTVFASGVTYYDTSVVAPWQNNTSNALCITIPQNQRTILAFRCDGDNITLWMNGVMRVKQSAKNYTSSYWATTFTLGNDVSGNNYNMSNMKCSMLNAWKSSLSDEEMAKIV